MKASNVAAGEIVIGKEGRQMNLINLKNSWMVFGMLGVASAAHADINYTTETTMPSMSKYKSVMARAVKPNFERYDSTTDMGTYKVQDITIRECGKKQAIKL